MTVASTTTQVTYIGNGSNKSFSVTFPFMESADLDVYLITRADSTSTQLTETTHYTVTGGDGTTGTVTTVAAYSSAYAIQIKRNTDFLQSADLDNQASYFLERVETALDKLTMIAQDISRRLNLAEYYIYLGGVPANSTLCYQYRERVATADINAGKELLAAMPSLKYRILNIRAIAIGGNAATVTTVDVLGTQGGSSVKLCAFAQANLTRSTVVRSGGTGGTVLADGASYAACDVNTAITVGKTGASLATATHIDIILEYSIDAA